MNEWRAISSSDFLPRRVPTIHYFRFIFRDRSSASLCRVARARFHVAPILRHRKGKNSFGSTVHNTSATNTMSHPRRMMTPDVGISSTFMEPQYWIYELAQYSSIVVITLITVNSRNSKHHPFSFGGNPLCAHTIRAPITLTHTESRPSHTCQRLETNTYIQSPYDSVPMSNRNTAHRPPHNDFEFLFAGLLREYSFIWISEWHSVTQFSVSRTSHHKQTIPTVARRATFALFKLHNLRHAR